MAFERDSEHELVWYSLLAFQDVSMYLTNLYQPCVAGSLVAALFYCAPRNLHVQCTHSVYYY